MALIGDLEKGTPSLRSSGLRLFDDLVGREMDRLAELFGVAVTLRERDTFLLDGGGCHTLETIA